MGTGLETALASFSDLTWWIAGIIMIVAEVFVGGTFLLWLGVAAILVGTLLFFGIPLSWEVQWLLFSIIAVGSIVLWRRFSKKDNAIEDLNNPNLSRRADRYIGRTFKVVEAIENGVGKVQVEDTLWRVLGDDAPVGSHVKVISIKGSSLSVQFKNKPSD